MDLTSVLIPSNPVLEFLAMNSSLSINDKKYAHDVKPRLFLIHYLRDFLKQVDFCAHMLMHDSLYGKYFVAEVIT
jgi:hypothetical protein